MKTISAVKLFLPVLVFFTLPVITNAQKKLPNLQEISLYAPVNTKIDGTATEWNNELQAYNKATDLSYTLSNDDEKLYLTVQAKYRDVVDKILRGGITLTINHTVKKKDDKAVSITYPVLRDADMSLISNKFAGKSNEYRENKGVAIKVDDLNELLQSKDKIIDISGIETISDLSISIYNNEGIKAASKFDDHLVYTCEIAIPLKFLALPNNGAGAFSYQIKVNETAAVQRPTHIDSNTPPPPPPVMTSALSTTYFWSEYTLAKK
jgi:hypothetical protein